MFAKTDGVRWHDIQPRAGVAYDVFGDGTTAVKAAADGRIRSDASAANASLGLRNMRMNQLDLRIGKILNAGGIRWTASVDLYNALNSSPVITQSDAYATWMRPQAILNARFAKLVLQLDF